MSVYSIVLIAMAIVCGLLMLWRIPVISSSSTHARPVKKISIIIPAYNEEKRLPVLMKSLRSQDYRPHQVIVVDDFSEDRTAEAGKSFGATVIKSLDLGEGWIGKSRACWSGAQAATGELLLFLDADVSLDRKDSLKRLVLEYENLGSTGILSVQPYHEVKKLYESFSAIFNIIVMTGLNVFTPLGEKIKSAGAFGPCIICKREEYFQIGGHKAIHDSIMDDLELGRAFQKSNRAVRCFGGRQLISFRMYPDGLSSLFEGWTKNFGTASQATHPLIFVMIIIWVAGGISSPFFFIRQIASGEIGGLLIISIVYYFLFCLLLIWQARRVGNFNLLSLLLYPVHFVFFTLLFICSMVKTKLFHSVSWRGRKIDV